MIKGGVQKKTRLFIHILWIRVGGGTVKQQGVIINLERKKYLKQANEYFFLLFK